MNSCEANLKKRLIAKRKDIKNKLEILKHGEIVRNDMFLPITKHLQNIENKLDGTNKKKTKDTTTTTTTTTQESKMSMEPLSNSAENPFSNIMEYDDDDDETLEKKKKKKKKKKKSLLNFTEAQLTPSSSSSSSSPPKFQPLLEVIKTDNSDEKYEEEEEAVAALEENNHNNITEESFNEYLEQYDPLPRKYVRGMKFDGNNEFDHKYGVRHNAALEKFYIGDSQLSIKGSDIVVKNKTYKGTRGLYELLFKKNPKEFTVNDEKAYKDIVLKTNANRRYYLASKQVDGSKLAKYKKIIAPISTTTTTGGRGMLMTVSSDNNIDYVHWDDPNELVERLRLLISSQQAGNSGHNNEINSIIEELREAQIIA